MIKAHWVVAVILTTVVAYQTAGLDSSPQSAAGTTLSGWRSARWGMTQVQVREAIGAEIQQATKPEVYFKGDLGLLAIPEVEVSAVRLTVDFVFRGDRDGSPLTAVVLRSKSKGLIQLIAHGDLDSSRCATLLARVRRLGPAPPPSACRSAVHKFSRRKTRTRRFMIRPLSVSHFAFSGISRFHAGRSSPPHNSRPMSEGRPGHGNVRVSLGRLRPCTCQADGWSRGTGS